MARAGGSYYSRVNKGFFEIPKPIKTLGIGVDNMTEHIKNSMILTGNDLGMLGNVEVLPEINSSSFLENWEVKQKAAQKMLKDAKIEEAWKVLVG